MAIKTIEMIPFLKQVAEDLVAKFGDNIKDCVIVFNNKRPASYLQKHLVDIYQKPIWSPQFFTISEFFAQATPLKLADSYTQFFTLYDCYSSLLADEGQPKLDLVMFQKMARIILGDFAQIDNDLVDADRLFSELEDIAEINLQFDFLSQEQKDFLKQFWNSYNDGRYKKQQEAFIKMWRRMPKLFLAFHQSLEQQGFTTLSRLYRQIANNQTDTDFTAHYKEQQLVFIGFNALSKAEAKAFVRWQEEGKAIFYFDTDSYYLEDETQEAGLFLRRNIKQLGLVNQLPNDVSYINDRPRQVNVFKVQGQTGQAKILDGLLQEEYLALSREEKIASTAIILADESLLIPVMQTIPVNVKEYFYNKKGQEVPCEDKFDIALNVTMGFALANSSLFGLMDLWLQAQAEVRLKPNKEGLYRLKDTVSYQIVEAFLSHPMAGLSDKKKSEIQDKLIAEQLLDVPLSRLATQKGLLSQFFNPVEQSQAIVPALRNIIEDIFTSALASKTLKKVEAELFDQVIKSLNRLDDLLKAHLAKYKNVDFHFVLGLVQKTLHEVSVPLQGSALEGLQVMGLLESRNLNFDRIIIVGLNEGIVPQTSTGNTFIPDSLRRAYGLPVLENQDAISAYMFYRLLQRSKKIDIVYNGLTDESSGGEVSRFVKQLEYESVFEFNHAELQLSVKTETGYTATIEKTEKVNALLSKYLDGTRKLSASALITYIANPIDFFYKYVAGIKEPEEVQETVEARNLGSILHYVMEYFYDTLVNEGGEITADRIKVRKKLIPDLIMEGFASQLYVPANNWEKKEVSRLGILKIKEHLKLNGMQKVVFAIIQEYVNIILDKDIAKAPFQIVQLEREKVIDFDIVVKGQVRQLKLKGVIDRVDLKDGLYQIVDYKTGSDILDYTTIDDCFNGNGNNLNKALVQTLFYTHVYEQATQKNAVEPQLYIVRKMRSGNVNFSGNKQSLQGEFLASEKVLFLERLKSKLEELFNDQIPFTPSEQAGNYSYSIYKTLFGG